MPSFSRDSRRPLHYLAFAAAILVAHRVEALSGRIGPYFAEGPGIWLEARHPIRGTDFGVHLAGSTIDLGVMKYRGLNVDVEPTGVPENTELLNPGRADALFYEWGLVAARGVHASEHLTLAVSTGFLGGLLDGTLDERVEKPASIMLLVPVFLEGDWHPWTSHERLGFTLGAGGVWTTPGDENELYPEISSWRWQARAGIIF